jgi:uncharacterized protein YjiS (DUF1127 family)
MATITESEASSKASRWSTLGAVIRLTASRIRLWIRQALFRRPLTSLTERELKDIGVTCPNATSAGNQAFWRARIELRGGF